MNKLTLLGVAVCVGLGGLYIYTANNNQSDANSSVVNVPANATVPSTYTSAATDSNISAEQHQSPSVRKQQAPAIKEQAQTAPSKPDSHQAEIQNYAASEYPEYFYGELAMLEGDDYYARAVISANSDNKVTPWTRGFQQFVNATESYAKSGMVNEQIKCSTKSCLITGKVKSKEAAEAIFAELTGKNQLWGVGVNGGVNDVGEYVIYISKVKLDEDFFSKNAQ